MVDQPQSYPQGGGDRDPSFPGGQNGGSVMTATVSLTKAAAASAAAGGGGCCWRRLEGPPRGEGAACRPRPAGSRPAGCGLRMIEPTPRPLLDQQQAELP